MPERPTAPRIAPLHRHERDEQTDELLEDLAISGQVLNVFTTLARHPRLFRHWLTFSTAVLLGGELPARERELLVLRTAYNAASDYEWGQHVAFARDAGLTDEEIARVARGPQDPEWDGFDSTLLRTADELHADACITDETWGALAERYDERQLIEVCMLVGQYHLVAFTLNSLGVEREEGVPGLPS